MRPLLILSTILFTGVFSELYVAHLKTDGGPSGTMLELDPSSGAVIGQYNVTFNKEFPYIPYLKDCDHPYVVFSPFTQNWSVGCDRELIVIYTQNPANFKPGFFFGMEYFYTLEHNGRIIGGAQNYLSTDRVAGCFRFHPQPVYEVTYKLDTFCYFNHYLNGFSIAYSYDLPTGFNISAYATGLYFYPESYNAKEQPFFVTVSNGTNNYLFQYTRTAGLVKQILFPLSESQLMYAAAYTHITLKNIAVIDTVNDGLYVYDFSKHKMLGGAVSLCTGGAMHQRIKTGAFDGDNGRLYTVVNCGGNVNLVTFDLLQQKIIYNAPNVPSQLSDGWLLYRMAKI